MYQDSMAALWVTCDECGRQGPEVPHSGPALEAEPEYAGWAFGARARCPRCAAESVCRAEDTRDIRRATERAAARAYLTGRGYRLVEVQPLGPHLAHWSGRRDRAAVFGMIRTDQLDGFREEIATGGELKRGRLESRF